MLTQKYGNKVVTVDALDEVDSTQDNMLTIEAAAELLNYYAGGTRWLDSIIEAIKNEELRPVDPNSKDIYSYQKEDNSGAIQIRVFHELLRVEELNAWLGTRKAVQWRFPIKSTNSSISESESILSAKDTSYLSTASKLIEVFEKFGLTKAKLNQTKQTAWLSNARKLKGRGGKNLVEAMYCPYEVMLGLVNEARPKKLSEDNGWRMLQTHFPKAYEKFENSDPRQFKE